MGSIPRDDGLGPACPAVPPACMPYPCNLQPHINLTPLKVMTVPLQQRTKEPVNQDTPPRIHEISQVGCQAGYYHSIKLQGGTCEVEETW